jgi:putative membrane protein insertion efficiency factor
MDATVDFLDSNAVESVRARQLQSGKMTMGQACGFSPDKGGLMSRAMVRAVGSYQRLISSHARRSCPFEPSCSQYMVLAIQKYGAASGSLKGFRRIARCNPFYKGSYVDWP